jgi:cell division FtsZ-interacting protein ZapD
MGIEKLLWLIRESAEPIGTVAVDGLYNHQIERKTQITLVRIFLKVKSIYPEISGGKHLIAVRFFEYDSKSDESHQYKSNVNFKISLC